MAMFPSAVYQGVAISLKDTDIVTPTDTEEKGISHRKVLVKMKTKFSTFCPKGALD